MNTSTNDNEVSKKNEEPSKTFLNTYLLLKKYKKIIIIITLFFLIISTIHIFFIADPIYLSTASVKTISKQSGLSGLLSSSGMSDLSGLSDYTSIGGSGAKELALYENILNSRRCIEDIIIKFKLNDEWEFKYMQDAVKNFRQEVLTISKDRIAGTMEIGVYDKDKVRAKEIADYLIFQLNSINTSLNVQNAKIYREFIQSRFDIVKKDLKQAEDSLKNYQDVFGVAPDIIVKAATQTEIQLEAEIKTEELKLDLLRKILSPNESEIKMQDEKISSLKKRLNEINNSIDDNSFLNLKGSPDRVMNFLRLQRNVEIQNKILIFLLPLFEQAKIEEKKETPSVIVLDYPQVPEYKSKPKRIKYVFFSTVFGLFLSLIFVIVYDKIRSIKFILSENNIK